MAGSLHCTLVLLLLVFAVHAQAEQTSGEAPAWAPAVAPASAPAPEQPISSSPAPVPASPPTDDDAVSLPTSIDVSTAELIPGSALASDAGSVSLPASGGTAAAAGVGSGSGNGAPKRDVSVMCGPGTACISTANCCRGYCKLYQQSPARGICTLS